MERFFSFLPEFVLFGSMIAFWAVIIVTVGLMWFWENREEGHWVLTLVVIVCIINYIWGDFNIIKYLGLWNVGLYLGLGLAHAFVRTYFYGAKGAKEFKEKKKLSTEAENVIQLVNEKESLISGLKNNVFRWWFNWVISLAHWIVTDLLSDVFDWIYKRIEKVFLQIFNLGFKE